METEHIKSLGGMAQEVQPYSTFYGSTQYVISRPHPIIYQLVDVIIGEQALTDLAPVQLDAGSQSPGRMENTLLQDQHLNLFKEAVK